MTDREALKRVIKITNVYKPLRVITNDISYRRKTKGNKKKTHRRKDQIPFECFENL
jgi:hypothetical protein